MSNSKNVSVQFPMAGFLGLIFITLKLTGYINWSWLWVLSPFWLPFVIALVIFILVFLGAIVVDFFSRK